MNYGSLKLFLTSPFEKRYLVWTKTVLKGENLTAKESNEIEEMSEGEAEEKTLHLVSHMSNQELVALYEKVVEYLLMCYDDLEHDYAELEEDYNDIV